MTATDRALDRELVSACRTMVGDEPRSLTSFTAADHRPIDLRDDLEYDENIDDFARSEWMGFVAQGAYRDPELGSTRRPSGASGTATSPASSSATTAPSSRPTR